MLVSLSQEMYFLIILQFKTPLVVNAAQHNITVYIATLTYERDPFDLKSILSQTSITEQRFSVNITVSMLTKRTTLYQILIRDE